MHFMFMLQILLLSLFIAFSVCDELSHRKTMQTGSKRDWIEGVISIHARYSLWTERDMHSLCTQISTSISAWSREASCFPVDPREGSSRI